MFVCGGDLRIERKALHDDDVGGVVNAGEVGGRDDVGWKGGFIGVGVLLAGACGNVILVGSEEVGFV